MGEKVISDPSIRILIIRLKPMERLCSNLEFRHPVVICVIKSERREAFKQPEPLSQALLIIELSHLLCMRPRQRQNVLAFCPDAKKLLRYGIRVAIESVQLGEFRSVKIDKHLPRLSSRRDRGSGGGGRGAGARRRSPARRRRCPRWGRRRHPAA